jgi:hypothetical protein
MKNGCENIPTTIGRCSLSLFPNSDFIKDKDEKVLLVFNAPPQT